MQLPLNYIQSHGQVHNFTWQTVTYVKLFLQELFREYATSSHHLRTEQDMHRKQIELEERIQQRLRDAEREREMEARKVFHFQGQLTVKSQRFSVREQILNFYMPPRPSDQGLI